MTLLQLLEIRPQLTTKKISFYLELSLNLTRKLIRVHRKMGYVTWYAHWYGRNAGYTRIYSLTSKGKEELKRERRNRDESNKN